jgi:ribonucleotide reductase alpha subunit
MKTRFHIEDILFFWPQETKNFDKASEKELSEFITKNLGSINLGNLHKNQVKNIIKFMKKYANEKQIKKYLWKLSSHTFNKESYNGEISISNKNLFMFLSAFSDILSIIKKEAEDRISITEKKLRKIRQRLKEE